MVKQVNATPHTLEGMPNDTATLENHSAAFYKIKNILSM